MLLCYYEGDGVFWFRSGVGALRRGRLAGQGPHTGSDAAIQESHRTGTHSIAYINSRVFRVFLLVEGNVSYGVTLYYYECCGYLKQTVYLQ